jgi:hypothetical protein
MSNNKYLTQGFRAFQDALKLRAEKHGDEVKRNFNSKCLKKINPDLVQVALFLKDVEWQYVPKPDDAPEPKSPGEADFMAETKEHYYALWKERVEKGEFDGTKSKSSEEDEKDEEVDVMALAKKQKKQKPQAPVEILPNDSKDVVETEDEEDDEEEVEEEVEDKQLPAYKANSLLTHLAAFVKEHAPEGGESDVMEHIRDLQKEINSIKESIPNLVKEALKKQFGG